MSKKATRLFEQFQPSNYKLNIVIDKENLTFSGTVTIMGHKSGRPSQRITLHQRGLKITSGKISKHSKNGTEDINIERINLQETLHEVRLHTKDKLFAGDYKVELAFNGKITETMLGIYPSHFTYDGKDEVIIATQFESHHAREAFPCIDEPEAKATFDLILTSTAGDKFISNMPTSSSSTKDGQTTTHFETTPKMSTYLLAFVIGKLHYVEDKTASGTLVRSWSSLARDKKELQYANTEAIKVLDFFTDYFGTPYPLPKCDQVALPDFDAGAMENWGLITYREIALLTDPVNRSISNEQYVSLVVAHELSHQWFGNLVTMKWWDDLWLNESFASLMEHVALDAIHPDWHQWELYTSTDVISTTNRDIYKDVQSVGVEVTDPDLIGTLFDPGIVYAKGGRLLKMLREYIGDEAFRSGLAQYFKKHRYANTTREDLWQAMSNACNKDISALMTPWITQSGMPLVTISQEEENVTLEQRRFILDKDNDSSLWPIPLLANRRLPIESFDKKTVRFKLDAETIILNQYGSGHYFTYYATAAQRQFIARALKNDTLVTESRINILNDSLMLARLGVSSLTDSLKLITDLNEEKRDSVWSLISRIVGMASQLTEGSDAAEAHLKSLKSTLGTYWYAKLGWNDNAKDDANTKQLRHTAIAFMLGGEDKQAIEEALSIIGKSSSFNEINAELRASILGTAVRHGEKKYIQQFMDAYPQASPDLQVDLTAALSSTKSKEVAHTIMHSALGKTGFVRNQDIMRWLAMFLRNRYTREVAWDFITSHWSWLEERLGEGKAFDYLPVYCASVMNTANWEKKYHQLFEPHLTNKTLQRNIQVGFSDIAARVAWRKRDEAKILKFLEDFSK